jgi:hypothetical protein
MAYGRGKSGFKLGGSKSRGPGLRLHSDMKLKEGQVKKGLKAKANKMQSKTV